RRARVAQCALVGGEVVGQTRRIGGQRRGGTPSIAGAAVGAAMVGEAVGVSPLSVPEQPVTPSRQVATSADAAGRTQRARMSRLIGGVAPRLGR
ncbi:hypothetical protein H7H73_30565, partial [Mycobacterium rufum]|nr:hypothetical protein [Mycolicibacterium rufum]